MKEVLKEIILDYQEVKLNSGICRHISMTHVQGKATVCIGVRRCGKSTFMFQRIQKLLDSGISQQNIFYINFFDDRLHDLEHQGLAIILEAYYALYPEKKNKETVYCFFDEIQVIPGWEPFIDRLLRSENCEVFITGSSAQMLAKDIATQMRGRALSWEMFPFSFKEYLDLKSIEYNEQLSTKKRLLIQKAFEAYWETGGFPEVAELDRPLRIKIHQEYFHAVLFRDLIERHDVSHPKAVSDLARRLIDNIASLYSVNKLTGYLQAIGHKVPKSAVANYLAWFEDAYFLFTVKLFDASLARANTNPKKIYCIDHAMVTSVGTGVMVNSGHLLENLVFNTLRRLSADIFYYKTKSGKEVDFIMQTQDRSRMLFQVCDSLIDPQTRKREISALTEAMRELDLKSGVIVTRNNDEMIDTESGRIEIVPAWRFVLNINQ